MRITDYRLSQQLLYQFGNSARALSQSYSELSSGQKIINSSDDPSQAAHVFSQQSDLRDNLQYTSNITRANLVSTVTYSNVKNLKDLVTRASELGVSTAGVTDPSKFAANRAEINGLIEQAFQIGNSRQGGQYLFAGNRSDTAPYTATRNTAGEITAVAYAGSTNTSTIPVAEGVNISPYSSGTQNQQINTVITNLIALRDAMGNQDKTAVKTATDAVIDDEDVVIGQLSDHAAIQSRLELLQNQIDKSSGAIYTDISARADVDIAQATVRYNMMQNAYQASVAAGSKMLSVSLLNYL